jgi:hypothetical protein
MYPHHHEAIDILAKTLKHDPDVRALIIGGSLAKGWGSENSDIDCYIVVTAERFAAQLQARQLSYFNNTICSYPGGYIDGKYVDEAWLRACAERGSEPARASFWHAWPAFSRILNLDALISQIPVYPSHKKEQNIRRFHAQFDAYGWYVDEGRKHHDLYLISHTINQLLFFGSRMILAHNEILYPYHKWLLKVLASAPHKPDGLLEVMRECLSTRAPEPVQRYRDMIENFTTWPAPDVNWPNTFMLDSEWNWLDREPPITDL